MADSDRSAGMRTGRRVLTLAFASLLHWAMPPLASASDELALASALTSQARYLASEALSYEHGEGVVRDQPYAARLYCEAARLGDAEAMHALGWMYANARGLERNDDYARTLFAMAASLGHPQAGRIQHRFGEYSGAAPDCLQVPAATVLQTTPVDRLLARLPAPRQQLAERLRAIAPEYGIDPGLALAIALAESALNPEALSPKNAMGVMQLIPDTAARFRVREPFDPEQNMRGGLAYLRWLLAYFEGDVRLVAAGYNAGEGAVNRYQGVPPYAETRAYVERILRYLGRDRHAYDANVVLPSARMSALRLVVQNDE